MIHLGPWDMITLTDVALVNQAMAARANELLVRFRTHNSEFRLKGTFDPWRILPGGAMGEMLVEMPVRDGQMRLPDGHLAQLGGVTLKVRLTLRLLPLKDPPDTTEIRFDLGALDPSTGEDAVKQIGYDDPHGQLTGIEPMRFRVSVARCLSEHAEDVSFVIASVETRGSAADQVFEMAHHAWASVATTDGRHYLAIAAAMKPPGQPFDTIDPQIFAKPGSAFLALSPRFMALRVIYPAVVEGFRPKTHFRCHGRVIANQVSIRLGKQTQMGINVEPVIEHLHLALGDTGLYVTARCKTDLPLGTYLSTEVKAHMPIVFDASSKTFGLIADKDPDIRHELRGTGPFGGLAKLLVGLFVGWHAEALDGVARALSRQMQGANLRQVDLSNWTGIRDFELHDALFEHALVLRDARPAEDLQRDRRPARESVP